MLPVIFPCSLQIFRGQGGLASKDFLIRGPLVFQIDEQPNHDPGVASAGIAPTNAWRFANEALAPSPRQDNLRILRFVHGFPPAINNLSQTSREYQEISTRGPSHFAFS